MGANSNTIKAYLCMQNKGSRYRNPSNGPREQPVTNL